MTAAPPRPTLQSQSLPSPQFPETPPAPTRIQSPPSPTSSTEPPLTYSREKLEDYWSSRSSEVRSRWANFIREAAPFFASVARLYSTGALKTPKGLEDLARDARLRLERLGPTYVKMGQMLSVRADIVPKGVREELARLQDGVKEFGWEEARVVMEEELGRDIGEVFEDIDRVPVAAASLAQVYRAKLKGSGEEVALKVQRNKVRDSVGCDLYVLIKAVGVWEGIVKRWTKQEVDYEALVDRWAEGFYGELDFAREASVQMESRERIMESTNGQVYVPKIYLEYCSRRLMVSEFCHGVKLTDLEPKEIAELIPIGQECFLKQLLESRHFHCDPHGGNLMKNLQDHPGYVNENDPRRKAKLILLDFGLVTSIPEEDQGKIVLAVVHMANSDWLAVTNDMVELGFLPPETNHAQVSPLLERILAPYVLGGGGMQGYVNRGKEMSSSTVQALINDLNNAATEIPFSINPYWPIIGRSIAILEGIALQGDPNYNIVMSSYPYMARRLLQDSSGSLSFRSALNEILYPGGGVGAKRKRPSPRRLAVLLNNALGVIASSTKRNSTSKFIDFDALPDAESSASLSQTLSLLMSSEGKAVRDIVVEELATGLDLLNRQVMRKAASFVSQPPIVRFPALQIPFIPIPLPAPRLRFPHLIGLVPETLRTAALDKAAPALTPEEDVYLGDLKEVSLALAGLSGEQVAQLFQLPTDPSKLLKMVGSVLGGNRDSASGPDAGGIRELLKQGFNVAIGQQRDDAIIKFASQVFGRYQQMQLKRIGEALK